MSMKTAGAETPRLFFTRIKREDSRRSPPGGEDGRYLNGQKADSSGALDWAVCPLLCARA